MRSKISLLVVALVLIFSNLTYAAVPPAIEAEAGVVMVAGSKQVLFEKNGNGIMYPASTTKIMTLLTALEQGKLTNTVTVSAKAAACEGSSLELRGGDKLTLGNALYGMMLVSGNDSAEAVAENIAGSIPKFVKLMNENATKIGAKKTHFSNPHGLPDPINHFTTAYDLALITNYGFKNPEFSKIVSTREYTVNFLNGKKTYAKNTNKLLKMYPGAFGVKTGFTNDAGDCLVGAAKRGNTTLIVVLLNDDYRWDDAVKLLDYGFQQLGL